MKNEPRKRARLDETYPKPSDARRPPPDARASRDSQTTSPTLPRFSLIISFPINNSFIKHNRHRILSTRQFFYVSSFMHFFPSPCCSSIYCLVQPLAVYLRLSRAEEPCRVCDCGPLGAFTFCARRGTGDGGRERQCYLGRATTIYRTNESI